MNFDTLGINSVICPYCNYERDSTWDDNEGEEFEEHEFQCSSCGEFFLANCEAVVDFIYTTKRYEEEIDE